MPLKLNCPRCKKALTLPRNVAGSYTKCAHCGGRIWVPELPGSESGVAPGSTPAPVAPIPRGTPPGIPPGTAPVAPPGTPPGPLPPPVAPSVPGVGQPMSPTRPSAPVSAPPAASVPPSMPAPTAAPWTAAGQARGAAQAAGATGGRKARFITAGTAESRLQPATDGKLPSLKLEQDEPTEKPKEKSEGATIHPLVLFCALCLSVLVSITMVLIDVDSPQTDRSREQTQARWTIEREYFSHLDPNQPLVAYQLLLRDAQRAHARGDQQAERDAYRRVLRLLRAERDRFTGLTGSPKSDRELEELITTILRE